MSFKSSRSLRAAAAVIGAAGVFAALAPAANAAQPLALVPQSGTYFGADVGSISVGHFQQQIGHSLVIHHVFVPFGRKLPKIVSYDVHANRIPLVSFGSGGDTRKIAAGDYDAYLSEFAAQIKALDGPVYLRFDHEMTANANASWVGTPDQFVAAWRHVYDLFAAQGVTKAAWVWEPTSRAFIGNYGSTVADAYYPGDAYVDWTGADIYNFGDCRGGRGTWRSFEEVTAPFYAWASHKNKPMMIPEFGTVEGTPGQKAAWFAQMQQTLQTQMPQIKAVVLFGSNWRRHGAHCDFRPTSSASSLASFSAMVSSTWFNPGN